MGKHLLSSACLALVLGSLSGFSHSRSIDQSLYDEYLVHTYPNVPKEKCFQASIDGLKDLQFDIETQDLQKGVIVTRRKSFTATGSVPTTSYYSGSTANGSHVSGYTHGSQTVQSQQSHKFYLQIIGAGSNCTVRTTRWRAWNEERELNEINVDYAQSRLWNPLFKEIEERVRH